MRQPDQQERAYKQTAYGQLKLRAGTLTGHYLQLPHRHLHYGPHQADCSQVHRRQGPAQAAGHQGRAQ
eukprot:14171-Chlamydomonas_euryale.AAC.1